MYVVGTLHLGQELAGQLGQFREEQSWVVAATQPVQLAVEDDQGAAAGGCSRVIQLPRG